MQDSLANSELWSSPKKTNSTHGKSDIHTILQCMQKARRLLAVYLPINNSFIALDILNAIMIHHEEGRELSVKQLMKSLDHSEAAIRQHHARLIEDDWITLVPHPEDARMRLVKPTDKLKNGYHEIMKSMLF